MLTLYSESSLVISAASATCISALTVPHSVATVSGPCLHLNKKGYFYMSVVFTYKMTMCVLSGPLNPTINCNFVTVGWFL